MLAEEAADIYITAFVVIGEHTQAWLLPQLWGPCFLHAILTPRPRCVTLG